MIYKLTKLSKNNKLLQIALTHTSYSNENNVESYERLEFLGDAVLQVVISEYLYKKTNLNEGDMSLLRANFVCEKALYEYSKKINLKDNIKVGKGISKDDINEAIISDVLEAVIAALYLSSGYNPAKKFIMNLVKNDIKENTNFLENYKSTFQEKMQTNKQTINYKIIKESGPAHNRKFEVELFVNDISYGKGYGSSKKEAEQNAAKKALLKNAGESK